MLVAYTAEALSYKPSYESPVIHIHHNGFIYLYKSLIKKLELDVHKDCVLFSLDPMAGENMSGQWYISKNPKGLPIKITNANKRNQTYGLTSSTLREKIISSVSRLFHHIGAADSFYMKCAEHPTVFNEFSKEKYYLIQIIT